MLYWQKGTSSARKIRWLSRAVRRWRKGSDHIPVRVDSASQRLQILCRSVSGRMLGWSVGIVFVKHTLKFRKYVKIFQIIKTLFVMYHEHLKVTTNSIFSLVCPFQEPVMLSTTHLMLLISLSQTKPSTFEMIFPSHPDIALNEPVSPQCLRLVLLSPKDFHNLPKSPDKSSRTSSMDDLSHSSFTPFDLLVGEAWVQIICYQKHSLPFGYITKLW